MFKNKYLLIIFLSTTIVLNAATAFPASENSSSSQPPAFVQFFLNVSNAIGQAIHDNISNKREFYSDVEKYNSNTTGQLKDFMGSLTRIFRGYSKDEGLENSGNNFFNNISQFAQNFWDNILAFPMLAKITSIVQPLFDQAIANFKSTLPHPHGDSNTPLSTFNNFYYEMAQNNPNDLGPLFDVKPYEETILSTSNSDVQESNEHGRINFNIRFKETQEYTDKELTAHQLIIDNKLVKNFEKPEDLTILHGMPSQMRKDGVDDNIVNFVQEELYYINWLLTKEHNEHGLAINTNHPQMQYPKNYSMRKFFNNFLAILKNWYDNSSETLYSWTQKLKA